MRPITILLVDDQQIKDSWSQVLNSIPRLRAIAVLLLSMPAYSNQLFHMKGPGYVIENSSIGEQVTAMPQVNKGKNISAKKKNIMDGLILIIHHEGKMISPDR